MPRAALVPCGCRASENQKVAKRSKKIDGQHKAVPSTSESGIFRLGFLTSPAVKVMLFHASAENSDPVCTTARMTAVHQHKSDAHAHLDRMQRPHPCISPELAQPIAKFAAHAVALRPHLNDSRTSAASDNAWPM